MYNAKLFELNPYVLRDPVLAGVYRGDQHNSVGRSRSHRRGVLAALGGRRNEPRLRNVAPQDANPNTTAAQAA